MALTKVKKHEIVAEVNELLASSKLTVISAYSGTPVKALQALRKQAKTGGTEVRVIKNRLVIKALASQDNYKDVDTSSLKGMLLYAFNPDDEVAPAQALASFAKTQPNMTFIGAITAEGILIGADDVKALASLPSKEILRAQLVGTLAAPMSGFLNVMAGNIRGVMNVLNARSEAIQE